ncbi:type II toxin-antitoxin system death-on-curing family toxin [Candidatus Oscillochloris fontis]|uniref:type II toxin-antitoxin system death-on-curing family toxin n=1 Tax=Candidatus Oscillochloris fontis TaxID=2496868 RepID=UPI00101E217E|nr:type II toxin-antitoxin system death-on-curing family toxin [Candidatus Oscillochloris fontis]
MTRYLTLTDLLALYEAVMADSGGLIGLVNQGMLESALAQPQATFDQQDLYPSLIEKTAALGFTLIRNHPFVDGNKRIGHAAMELFLILNGWEIVASVDAQEDLILQLAAGTLNRDDLVMWLHHHVVVCQ